MNDNYVWDKSGEPDEEIQHLESLLSEFRYQPRTLVLPEVEPERLPQAATMMGAKATILSLVNVRYAALAAMAFIALGAALWLSTRSTTNAPERAAATPTPTATVAPRLEAAPPVAPSVPAPQMVQHFQATPKTHFAVHKPKRAPRKSLAAEGEAAKEKVLYALQVTSEKLNLIAKRVQTDTN